MCSAQQWRIEQEGVLCGRDACLNVGGTHERVEPSGAGQTGIARLR